MIWLALLAFGLMLLPSQSSARQAQTEQPNIFDIEEPDALGEEIDETTEMLAPLAVEKSAFEAKLVPDVSQREVRIRYGFTGAELLLFGAILDPRSLETRPASDIIVLLKGPSQAIIVREKQKLAGIIWVNADTSEFRSAPSYYGIASSQPIAKIINPEMAAIYEFGVDNLQLSPAGAVLREDYKRFSAGLVDLNMRHGLFVEKESSVEIVEDVLYQARLKIPSSVPTGRYTAETFLVQNGEVIASASRDIYIRKYGFERFVADASQHHGFLYGMVAVLISLLLGWLAGVVFRKG